MKWEKVHPDPGRYDFDLPDKYVAFGEKSHMFIVGHTLVWHHQTSKWVFEDAKGNPGERDTLLARMGLQGHYRMDWPSPEQVDGAIAALAKRYADLFGVFLKHRDAITRVTF